MVPKGGEYESYTQNLDIYETRKLYVSKSNFANMKVTELSLHHGTRRVSASQSNPREVYDISEKAWF